VGSALSAAGRGIDAGTDPGGATVRIQVVEGYVDTVVWPSALSRYRDFFSHYAAKIVADRPANIRTVERYLLLAGDLPGLKFSTSLKPSKTKQGAATLVVEVVEKRIDANAHVDNRGTPARGPFEYYGSVAINNLFGWHDESPCLRHYDLHSAGDIGNGRMADGRRCPFPW